MHSKRKKKALFLDFFLLCSKKLEKAFEFRKYYNFYKYWPIIKKNDVVLKEIKCDSDKKKMLFFLIHMYLFSFNLFIQNSFS